MQRGFIQIPTLIIFISVFAVGIAGYVGVKQYQNNQIETSQQKTPTQSGAATSTNLDFEDALSEIEKLRQEIDDLKKQEPQIITQTIVREVPQPDTEKDLATIIKNWTPRVARITCLFIAEPDRIASLEKAGIDSSPEVGTGSGFLMGARDSELGTVIQVMTNAHVLSGHNGFTPADKCTVEIGNYSYQVSGWDESIRVIGYGKEDEIKSINSVFYLERDLDAGVIIIKDPDPEVARLAQEPFTCPSKPMIGEDVVVIGFPGIGASKSITATEGIISGVDPKYYVTSAKVEQGNSGGAAFWLKQNCYIGIPTFSLTGEIESLARILDITEILKLSI